MTERGGYERSDLPPAVVAGAITGLLALVALGALVAWGLLAGFRSREPVVRLSEFDRSAAVAAPPQLEVHQGRDRIALDLQAQGKLTGYGWSDPKSGLARIPIERAMGLLAARGWPDADTNAGPAQRAGQTR